MRGLYVHVPYCARACPYCDFDFEVTRRPDVDAYLAGLRAEVEQRGIEGPFDTVYIGGGTPSVLGPEGLRRLLDGLRPLAPAAVEWTVEFNPEHVDDETMDAVAGVHRISLGVQSFHARSLRLLGRAHTPDEAVRAIEAAGAFRVSVDVIVHDTEPLPIPDSVEHVSVYALTIEEGTPWLKTRPAPDPDAQTDALRAAEATLSRDFVHYEVASYARTPQARARHNLGYWTWRDYVGLGPSAASARYDGDGVTRRKNPRGVQAWLRGDPPTTEILPPERAAAEGLWLGLRVLTGLDVAAFLARFPGVDRAWIERRTARQRDLGNVVWADTLRVAPDRWLFHDDIAADLLLLK